MVRRVTERGEVKLPDVALVGLTLVAPIYVKLSVVAFTGVWPADGAAVS